jgi:WD40 repeat protein
VSEPGVVSLWDSRSRKVTRTLRVGGQVTGCAFAYDGASLAAAADGSLRLFTLDIPSNAATDTSGFGVRQVQFAPNGLLASASSDGSIRLWSTARTAPPAVTPRLLSTVPNAKAADQGGAGSHPLTFSSDSRTLAVVGSAATELVDVSDPQASHVVGSIPGGASSVRFSPDSTVLAVGGKETTLWDVRDRAHPQPRSSTTSPQQTGQGVGSVSFTPDGHRLITGSGGLGEVWTVNDTGAPVFANSLTTGPNEVFEADVSPDGRMAAIDDVGGLISLWLIDDRKAPRASATLPLGPTVVAGLAFPASRVPTLVVAANGGAATLWNGADPARPRQVETAGPGNGTGVPRSSAPEKAVFSADGRRFAITDNGAVDLFEDGADDRISRVSVLTAPAEQILTPAALSADGRVLAVATTDVKTYNRKYPLALWDVGGQPRLLSHLTNDGAPDTVTFSPDEHTLVVAAADTITTWDVRNLAHPVQMALRSAHAAGSVGTASFTGNGKLLAITRSNAPGTLWDIANPAAPGLLSTTPGIEGVFPVDAVFAGHTLVVGTLGAINVWDITDPTDPIQLTIFASGAGPFTGRLAVSSSGMLATAQLADARSGLYDGLGVVRLWDLSQIAEGVADPVAVACRVDGGTLSPDMWRRYAPDLSPRLICR